MAVTGRKPKPEGQAVNRNKPVHDWTEVENVPFTDGPKLPRTRVNGQPWMKRTKDKWAAWASMPHCSLWGPAEWDFALDSIELAALVHAGEPKYATELRNRERVLGTTADYLRDLRIRYVDPKPEGDGSGAEVTNIADYRDL
ncbi:MULTISPECIES: phage terminase small subunit [Mycolicibacterium]|jgi:hypothetical protein|uniref:Terminase small subunit n=3 Tax=Mycolicibacterium TaxID=1866885 RepID=A0AAE5AF79_MYCFO|nr:MULTISPECIES: hypothetical protein [Mycolicibacterium]KLI04515.1 hypothetical protein AA982_29445 [Mycolicibacterium senegalense]KLO53841.1 hypothetical protein ABW05_22485 [Mycolicibacterium senegalense]KMV16347.1 hypothetical protein ACT17_20480 [Mycolicibacterium conceptionense]MDV7194298.1 hypothetical protein [Mycolicibacterium fortuitum]MDV7294283.1 hypothetical protein [Mycolicibacterium fortuitum]